MQVVEIALSEIIVKDRAREQLGDMGDLIDSIKQKGVIQPITITKDNVLLAGRRRMVGAKSAGLEFIPAIVREVEDDIDAKEIELFENIHRKDMAWSEEVRLMKQIDNLYKEKHDGTAWPWSKRKTAELVGKPWGTVERKLKLAEAIEIAPELADCKTENEAIKKIQKFHNDFHVQQLREQQEKEVEQGQHQRVKYASEHYKIGDALNEMEGLVEYYKENHSSIKLIEVDPPYGIDLEGQKRRDDTSVEDDLQRYTEVSRDEYPAFLKRLTQLLYATAGDDCWVLFWYGPTWHTDVKVALVAAGFKVDDIPCIWNKGHGQTMSPDLYLARSYEPFFVARKGNPVIKKKGRSNVFTFNPVAPTEKYHPTQRPLDMMCELLETFAVPKDVVMIPFLGSGVTLRAVYRSSMNGFGWDLDQKNKDHFLLQIEKDYAHEDIKDASSN